MSTRQRGRGYGSKSIARDLRGIIRHLEMRNCSFGSLRPVTSEEQELLKQYSGRLNEQGQDGITLFIKERTRIWRESWVLAPLRDMLAQIESKSTTP